MHELSSQEDALGGPTRDGSSQRETRNIEGPAWQVTEVQKAVKGADYPMTGEQMARLAKSNGADDELVEALRGLREVGGPKGVMKELKAHLGGERGSEG